MLIIDSKLEKDNDCLYAMIISAGLTAILCLLIFKVLVVGVLS